MKNWIVFANKTECNVFERSKNGLVSKHSFSNPTARQKGVEVFTDGPGLTKNSADTERAGYSEPNFFENVEKKFAKEITDYLDRERHLGHFDRLILVSGPVFIGRLRDASSKELQSTIGREVVKNFSLEDEAELEKVVGELGF